MTHLKVFFWRIVFIAINIIQVIVFYRKESTDFIHNLCQTKFNNWFDVCQIIDQCSPNCLRLEKRKGKINFGIHVVRVCLRLAGACN